MEYEWWLELFKSLSMIRVCEKNLELVAWCGSVLAPQTVLPDQRRQNQRRTEEKYDDTGRKAEV